MKVWFVGEIPTKWVDLDVNPCKEKKLTNLRASGKMKILF